jgi:hypothetical protein
MHHRAAPCNPNRASRRGAARLDVIVMIVMCVAVVGVAIWAFVAYGNWRDDELVTSRLEAWVPVVEGEYQAAVAALGRASKPLGFVGPTGGVASAARIEATLQNYYSENPPRSENPIAFVPPADVSSRDTSMTVTDGRLTGVTRIAEAYGRDNNSRLLALIDAQDRRINALVEANGAWRSYREREAGYLEEALQEYLTRLNTFTSNDAPALISNNATQITNAITQYLTAATSEANAKAGVIAELNDSYEVIAAARDALAVERNRVGPAADEARRIQELAANQVAKIAQQMARSGDFRGFVEQVDRESGYVWISLGQSDNIRREMSFQVAAPTADGTATVIVAEIRVKNVIGPHLSQARIDFLRDDNVLPKAGDYVRNTAYSAADYHIFAFAGDFGGRHSRYSRQQLTELLERNGRQIQNTPRDNVEVVIVGANFVADENFRRLQERGVRFERMTEREILYMFEISRPD